MELINLRSRRFWIFVVVLLALLIRVWAANRLPVDFDEPVYVQAGIDYAELIKSGDLMGVINYPENPEHPPLIKLLYGMIVLALKDQAQWWLVLLSSRYLSVLFGTLAVLIVALMDPLAGGLMAVQTLMVKYTGQAYLEALPLFASVFAVYALLKSSKLYDRWFWFSAFTLGMTAAGKFSYFPILIVVLYLYIFEKKYPWKSILIFLFVGGAAFFALNPSLWSDPLDRFIGSILFHAQYSQGEHVLNVGYPWYQPILWVARSWGYEWHPGVIVYFGFDGLIFLSGLIGLRFEWQNRRWVVVWLVSGMLFLLLWPTKWPQYALVVLPAFCLSASVSMTRAYRWLQEQENYYQWFTDMLPKPSRFIWVGAILLVVVLALGWLVNSIVIGFNRVGWSNINSAVSELPSNTVYAVLISSEGDTILGTNNGAVIWSFTDNVRDDGEWTIYNQQNSSLPDNRVLSVAEDPDGGYWFGTRSGLAHYDGSQWKTFVKQDFGLQGEEVHAVAVDSQDRVWIGTNAGAAVFDGDHWVSFSTQNSPLLVPLILSMEIEQSPTGDVVWFGTAVGVNRLEPDSGEWEQITPGNSGLGVGGVSDLLIDSSGRLWIATLGGGFSIWDGLDISRYSVSNSDLPYNIVQAVYESDPGVFWIATSIPNRSGGLVSRFDGAKWESFPPNRSGYSGAETMTISQTVDGKLLFGTLTAGVDIYEPKD